MKPASFLHRPVLAPGVRYRWDEVRRQHQLVFPEGLLVLNDSAAAVVRLCDGRSTQQLIRTLRAQVIGSDPSQDVQELLDRLAQKGLLRDGDS
jgi:coenzyme PQQ biosynthesis protein PqqD